MKQAYPMNMLINLQDERPTSWNTFYSGRHWSVRSKEADRVHGLIRWSVQKKYVFKNPVDITFTVYFKNRPLDCDNIAVKMYIDGLKGRVIKDDTPNFVRSVKTISLVDKENPRVEILLKETL